MTTSSKLNTKRNQFIIVVQTPLQKRDYDRFGVAYYKSKGLQVEVWEISKILFPEMDAFYELEDRYQVPELKVFESKIELFEAISTLDRSATVWITTSYDRRTAKILKSFKETGAKVGMAFVNPVPPMESAGSTLGFRIKHTLLNPQFLLDHLHNRIPNWIKKIPTLDFYLYGGRSAKPSGFLIGEETQIIPVHSFDYDRFLSARDLDQGGLKGPYAVYLDEYIPFHPDSLCAANTQPIKPESYYRKINHFFDVVEEKLKVPVKIAVHPKAKYDAKASVFQGREGIWNQTDHLIKNCQFVIGHSSTSLGLAVMFHKPVVITHFEEFKNSDFGYWIESMAKALGRGPYFTEDAENMKWTEGLTINETAYEHYMENYVKEKSVPDSYLAEIVSQELLDCP